MLHIFIYNKVKASSPKRFARCKQKWSWTWNEVNLLRGLISVEEDKVSKESDSKYYWVWSLLTSMLLGKKKIAISVESNN